MSFADVESANIVGYSTYTAVKGFNLCAVNFKNIGEKAEYPIIDLFPGVGKGVEMPGLNYRTGLATGADYMMVSTGPGSTDYNMYFLYYFSKGGTKNYRWLNADGNVVLDEKTTIKNGDAFWFVKDLSAADNGTKLGLVLFYDGSDGKYWGMAEGAIAGIQDPDESTGFPGANATPVAFDNDGMGMVVAATAVPEPTSGLLLLLGVAGLALRRRRA